MAVIASEKSPELIAAIRELSEYLGENPIITAFNVGNSFFTAAEAWRKANPVTTEEVADYYRTTPSLVHQLVFANYGIPHELELILRTQQLCEGAHSVLDLGAGIGSFLVGVNAHARRVHADFPGPVFEYAKWRYRGTVNMRALRDDYLQAPPGDEKFDVVICTEVLEHTTEPELLVKLLSTLVKPGGKLVATVSFDDVDGTVPQHLNVGRWTDEEFITTIFPRHGFKRISEEVFELEAK